MQLRKIRVVVAAMVPAASVLWMGAALRGAADEPPEPPKAEQPKAEQPKTKNRYAVFADPKSDPKADPKADPKGDAPKSDPKADPKEESPKSDPKADPKAVPLPDPKADPKAVPLPDPKADPKAEPKSEPKSDPKAEPKHEPAPPEVRPPEVKKSPYAVKPAEPALADGKVRFFTKDIDLEALLQFLEKAVGVKVYRSGLVLPQVRIAMNAEKPITVDEALDTLNAVLQTLQPTGYTLIDDRPRFVTIVPLTAVKSAEIPLLPKDPKAADLKDRSRVVRAIFSVRGDDGATMAVTQRSLISPWGELVFNKADNSLTVVDTEKRVKVFRQYLDGIMPAAVGQSGSDMVTYPLKYIDAEEAAGLLRTVVTGASPRPNAYAVVAPPPAGGGEKVGFLVVPNPRTRQLLIRGTAEQHALVKEVLDKVDVQHAERTDDSDAVKVIRVQSDPDALADNLREMFREGGGSSASSGSAGGRPKRFGPPDGGAPAAPTDPSAAAAPVRMSIRITPNREQRCLVISGPAGEVTRAEKIINEIDQIQAQNPQASGTRTFEIHHGSAEQIAAKLNQIFEGRPESNDAAGASATSAASAAPASRYSDNPYLVRTSDSSGSSGSSASPSSGYGDRSFGDRGFGRRSRSGGSNGGRVAIAENRLNLLIVTAPNGEFAQIDALIKELDRGGDVGVVVVPKGRPAEPIMQRALEIFNALKERTEKK